MRGIFVPLVYCTCPFFDRLRRERQRELHMLFPVLAGFCDSFVETSENGTSYELVQVKTLGIRMKVRDDTPIRTNILQFHADH